MASYYTSTTVHRKGPPWQRRPRRARIVARRVARNVNRRSDNGYFSIQTSAPSCQACLNQSCRLFPSEFRARARARAAVTYCVGRRTVQIRFKLIMFTVVYAGAAVEKCPSHYLQKSTWVETLKATMKGVRFGKVDSGTIQQAKILLPAMQQRLHYHVEEYVDPSKHGEYTLDFVRDNLPAMAAIKCLIGQIVDQPEMFGVDECLLQHPGKVSGGDVFFTISNAPEDSRLGSMEGDYLCYDTVRRKLIRSGKASGLGKDACFV